MANLQIDMSGRSGLAPEFGKHVTNAYLAEPGQVNQGIFNPFMRNGYLSPANSTVESVTFDQAPSAQMIARVYDAINNDFYFAEEGRQIWKGDGTTDIALERVIQLADAGGIIKDLEIYCVNGVPKIFVMYEDTGGTAEIAISSLPYNIATDNETWTGTVAGDNIGGNSLIANTTEHQDFFMEKADNGFAYLFMANQVHKLDGTSTGGTNGTMTANILLFPATFRITDAVDFLGNMFIALHQYNYDDRHANPGASLTGSLQVGVYVWDRTSTVVSSTSYFPIPGAREIKRLFINPDGDLMALTVNNEGVAELRQFDGRRFSVVFDIGFGGHPVKRDGLDTHLGMATWITKAGDVFAYGKVTPNSTMGLYKLFSASTASSTGGIIMSASGTSSASPAVYLEYQATGGTLTHSRLKTYSLTGQIGGTAQCNTTEIIYPKVMLPQMSTVHNIQLYLSPTSTTTSTTIATVKVYFNGSSSAWASKTVTFAEAARGYKWIEVNKPNINSIQLSVTYPGSTNISASDDFSPSIAVVTYDDTGAKG